MGLPIPPAPPKASFYPPPAKKARTVSSSEAPSPHYNIPQIFFIPVPMNVNQATTIYGRMRIAKWALDKALLWSVLPSSLNYEEKQLIGISWYLSWCLGFVAYLGTKVDTRGGNGLLGVEWDSVRNQPKNRVVMVYKFSRKSSSTTK